MYISYASFIVSIYAVADMGLSSMLSSHIYTLTFCHPEWN